MLQKTPKSRTWGFIKSSAKILLVVEAVLFATSYGLYYRINTDREFRHFMNDKFPFFLKSYYSVGELFGDSKQRELDSKIWEQETIKKE